MHPARPQQRRQAPQVAPLQVKVQLSQRGQLGHDMWHFIQISP